MTYYKNSRTPVEIPSCSVYTDINAFQAKQQNMEQNLEEPMAEEDEGSSASDSSCLLIKGLVDA